MCLAVRPILLLLLASVFCTFLPSAAQTPSSPAVNYPFLLHLETMTFDDDTCVLVRRDGQFHLEEERGERTKVIEGSLPDVKLIEVENLIKNDGLSRLTQAQVAAPSGYIMLDELHVNIFRGDHWQNLFFPDIATRKPFDDLVGPLVRWLESLHKEPHRELTEDEGKNDCQLPKRIVLKTRNADSSIVSALP